MSKLGSRAFFSFSAVTDQSKHREYGAWHALDHLPENIALDGVALGTRWVRSPRCAQRTRVAEEELAGTQYLTTYWFRDPHEHSIRQWDELASVSRHWGRRPDLAWTRRLRRGFYVPTKGYVDPTALVPADVLPFRPTRGVYVQVSRFAGPPVDVVAAMQWYDEVHIPDLIGVDGAAGAWSFVSEDTFMQDRAADRMTSFRVLLVYLDGDPVQFADDVASRRRDWEQDARWLDTTPVETPVLEGPLEAVLPWTWDWFDSDQVAETRP